MDSNKIANWLQIAGNLGVVAGLILVAVQIDQTSRQVQHGVTESRAGALRDLNLARAMDEQFLALYVQANRALGATPSEFVQELVERAEMTEEQALQLSQEQIAWWFYRVQIIPHADELPAGEREDFDRSIQLFYGQVPLSRLRYEHTRDRLTNREAVSYVDELLAQPG